MVDKLTSENHKIIRRKNEWRFLHHFFIILLVDILFVLIIYKNANYF